MGESSDLQQQPMMKPTNKKCLFLLRLLHVRLSGRDLKWGRQEKKRAYTVSNLMPAENSTLSASSDGCLPNPREDLSPLTTRMSCTSWHCCDTFDQSSPIHLLFRTGAPTVLPEPQSRTDACPLQDFHHRKDSKHCRDKVADLHACHRTEQRHSKFLRPNRRWHRTK